MVQVLACFVQCVCVTANTGFEATLTNCYSRKYRGQREPLVSKRKHLDGLHQIPELADCVFLCTDCIIQFTVYQAQKPHLIFNILLGRLKREEDDEVRGKSAMFPLLDLMNL